ncbi:hypothetical protein AB0B40_17145 [Streptomyces sp. NPDC042638]|uniref:hypothetical protein n=1 Tax=Streptomyces sp. NPDC042638 TaxID=3154333 RepID=UPI0033CCB3D5
MLCILDARTGEPVPAAPARRGLTRIEAHASGLDPTALRVLLTADLLVRALELGGTPVWTILTAPRDQPELCTAATRLAIRPFEDGRDLASGLGDAQAIHVAQRGYEDTPGEGPVVAVAPAQWAEAAQAGPGGETGRPGEGTGRAGEGTGRPGEESRRAGGGRARPGEEAGTVGGAPEERPGAAAGGPSAPGLVPDTVADPATATAPSAPSAPSGPSVLASGSSVLAALLSDPAALRLALLAVPRSRPVRLDAATLDDAARSLARWRRAVAGWARQPSRPVPGEVRERLRAAWDDDLDLPAVLGVLRDVESAPGIPDGARFETYAYADRLLALDLLRDLGNPA